MIIHNQNFFVKSILIYPLTVYIHHFFISKNCVVTIISVWKLILISNLRSSCSPKAHSQHLGLLCVNLLKLFTVPAELQIHSIQKQNIVYSLTKKYICIHHIFFILIQLEIRCFLHLICSDLPCQSTPLRRYRHPVYIAWEGVFQL